jgi:hypothetical protein
MTSNEPLEYRCSNITITIASTDFYAYYLRETPIKKPQIFEAF